MIIECDRCGIEFEPEDGIVYSHNYCSKRCEYEQKGAPKKKKKESRRCLYCGKAFKTSLPINMHKYCSQECVQKAYKETYIPKPQIRAPYLIFNRDGFSCAYCGKTSYHDGVKLNIDHVMPRALGGTDEAANLITACTKCNFSKGATKPSEYGSILHEIEMRNKAFGIHPQTIIKNYMALDDVLKVQSDADTDA